MKEYTGAVFFVDILGIGALTQEKIKISKDDFTAHKFNYEESFSNHQFCAKLLLKFRRILTLSTANIKKIKVAQLSDCAFIWSEDPNMVINVARDIMWRSLTSGILCRGGIARGQIVEPDKINRKLGMFICGGAVSDAVGLEGSGKGARVFINPDLVPEADKIPDTAFTPRKSHIDFKMVDEFKWYNYQNDISSPHYRPDKEEKIAGIISLISMLMYSPKYSWNDSSDLGRAQLASSIEIISLELNKLNINCEYENLISQPRKRSDIIQRRMLQMHLADLKQNALS